jgi:hypothetical protein
LKRVLLACLVCLTGIWAYPASIPVSAQAPALPDLYPELHTYAVNATATCATAGTPVALLIYVHNAGPGNITSANITISVDGPVIAVVPAVYDFSAEGYYGNIYTWDTTGMAPGNHTIGILVNDSAGDANPANNTVAQNFTIVKTPPGMNIVLDEAVVVAYITESAPGFAVITGNITVTALGGEAMDVTLGSSVDIGWVSGISPGRFRADREGRYAFSVCVTVPQGMWATNIGRVQISANGGTGNDTVRASAVAVVQVHPYYRLTLHSNNADIKIPPGGQAVFDISLTNAGNAQDSFEIEVANLNELAAKKWLVALSANTVSGIQPGEYKRFTVTARASDEWVLSKSESTRIVIRATSTGNRSTSLVFPIYVYEEGSNPGWYNYYTIDIAVVLVVVAAVAGLLMWRKKRKAVGIKPGPEVKN